MTLYSSETYSHFPDRRPKCNCPLSLGVLPAPSVPCCYHYFHDRPPITKRSRSLLFRLHQSRLRRRYPPRAAYATGRNDFVFARHSGRKISLSLCAGEVEHPPDVGSRE